MKLLATLLLLVGAAAADTTATSVITITINIATYTMVTMTSDGAYMQTNSPEFGTAFAISGDGTSDTVIALAPNQYTHFGARLAARSPRRRR